MRTATHQRHGIGESLTSLNLSFLICKMTMIQREPPRAVVKIKGINACEATAIVMEHTVILLEAWGVAEGGGGRLQGQHVYGMGAGWRPR